MMGHLDNVGTDDKGRQGTRRRRSVVVFGKEVLFLAVHEVLDPFTRFKELAKESHLEPDLDKLRIHQTGT